VVGREQFASSLRLFRFSGRTWLPCSLQPSEPALQQGIFLAALFSEMDLPMAVWTYTTDLVRVVWPVIREPAAVMRL
jgi:hypothetical protein